MRVTKRNGSLEPLDLTKIHKVLEWAVSGNSTLPSVKGVSVSQIELAASLKFHDKMKTSAIHEALIASAAELITEDTPNYDIVAGRLVWFAVRKEAFGQNVPPSLLQVVTTNCASGRYDPDLLNLYTSGEWGTINTFIDHSRDDLFRYAGAEQMRKKYLVQDRRTKRVFESFQFPYILVAAVLFSNYPKDTRLKYVKEYYDSISQHNLNEPTPVMAGVRTAVKQFSSCVLVSSGDSLKSINATANAIVEYASRKAGLGIDFGRIRAEGQAIRNGDAISTGVIPFAKYFNAALKSCSQGAVRGASATANYPFWHMEFSNLIELKNEKGTEETRIRTMDYCPHFNRIFFERWVEGKDLSLFSPEEVPGLWDAFYGKDIDLFRTVYEQYERNKSIKRKTIPDVDMVNKYLSERFETSRTYAMFADTVNKQTPFYEPVTLTNLCLEICLPTVEMGRDDSSIALCTLGAINLGRIGNLRTEQGKRDLEHLCELAVRAKDALLSYQEYPLAEARRNVEDYRPLGFGAIGFGHWLAKNNLRWGAQDTLDAVNFLMEHISYYLIKASVKLASELGPCRKRTRYHDGWMPFDDSPLTLPKTLDWDSLREDAKKYGIRNATLMAFMPSETSSILSNETNGIEPPRSLVTSKGSKDGSLNQLVPEYATLNHRYETLWDVKASDYIETLAVFQHYMDQAISANTSYDPSKCPRTPDGKIKISHLASDFLLAYKRGLKTIYYNNIRDDADIQEDDDGCAGGACKI